MTRVRLLALALAVLGLALSALAPGSAPQAQGRSLDDLMMDLNIAPLEPHAPPAFTVTTLEGGRVTLGDVKGHAVLVYFWATW